MNNPPVLLIDDEISKAAFSLLLKEPFYAHVLAGMPREVTERVPDWARNWEAHSTAAIRRMQELETENNRLFIAAYGLDGELQPEVPEAQITLARAEARRDMAASRRRVCRGLLGGSPLGLCVDRFLRCRSVGRSKSWRWRRSTGSLRYRGTPALRRLHPCAGSPADCGSRAGVRIFGRPEVMSRQ